MDSQNNYTPNFILLPSSNKKQSYNKSKYTESSKYNRPYCVNCKLIYGPRKIGFIDKCDKCGQILIINTFNPWPKCFKGLIIISLGALTLLLGLPIVWIGGFIWGGRLIFNGFNEWEKIKALNNK